MLNDSHPKQPSKSDKRIQLTQAAVVIALLASIGLTLSASISQEAALFCIVAYFGIFAINYFGFFLLKQDNSSLLLYALLSAFIWISYVVVFASFLFQPKLMTGENSTVSAEILAREIVPIFLTLSPALALFFVGLLIGPSIKNNLGSPREYLPNRVHYGYLVTTVVSIIFLKFVGQLFFDVGSPIKSGHGLPPLILAAYEFLVQDVTIVILNVLFFTLLYLRIKKGMIIVCGALVINVGLSLSAGWKGEMVFQALVLAYFFFAIRHRASLRARRRILIFSTVFITSMLIIYPYVNAYRWASSQGYSLYDAINKAQQSRSNSSERNEAAGMFKMLQRVDSIGTYISSIQIAERRKINLPIAALMTNEFSNMVKYELYGDRADEVMVAFATTQFAALYIVGGWIGLYIGAFCLGMFMRNYTTLIANYVIKYTTTVHAYLPLLCFTWLSVLLTGGNISFKLKELFVVIVSIIVVERLTFSKRTTTVHEKNPLAQDIPRQTNTNYTLQKSL